MVNFHRLGHICVFVKYVCMYMYFVLLCTGVGVECSCQAAMDRQGIGGKIVLVIY